ncbi:hypothetical protein CFP65_3972 [Kitasatospora sp. MMS16-BH015]|uniref:hypothetical protein n=1 Tax=Kitasatospora sp. MMS16-BH015 TaxID=2018025 RepID=UPI000CA238D0|nr:hypothetical protein [Kitasatospora sp. MMS16-BH015]AUG78742.1 hypothetical protein CFP65_3972 [Kitasatospora sp. MMS16-BH015]
MTEETTTAAAEEMAAEATVASAEATPAAAQADPTVQAAQAAQAAPTAPAARRGGFALRAGAAVLAAALLGVGIGEGILKVAYPEPSGSVAAAPAPAPSASAPPAFGAKSDGTHFGSLRDLLAPMPAGYLPGPDAGAYGNDTELTEDQRKSWVEDSVLGLPAKLQQGVRDHWKELRLKGAGVRSYTSTGDDLVVTVWLLQYHQDAVKADNAFVEALGSDSGLFRTGPDVPGHAEAHCYLPYAAPGDAIDSLVCSAAEGDLRVEMRVEGVAPLPKSKAVTLFTQQLDRLARPGAQA